jgi:DNA repair protein RadC
MPTTPVLCAEALAPIRLDPTGTRPPIVTEALQWLERHIRQGPLLSAPVAVHDYLRLRIAHHDHEVFTVLFLDAQNRLIEASELFRGTLTQTSVYPREIAREALARNAASVILAHNHPSGSAEPSAADRALTHNVRNALHLLDIRVLDHFVVTRSHCLSFAERGLLS